MALRLGTRASALALAQAETVQKLLAAAGAGDEVELVPITTAGDEGGAAANDDKSRFVKEIEDALLAGEVDLAVHSAKDVPAELPAGLAIVGVPARADARDALCVADDGAEGVEEGPSTGSLKAPASVPQAFAAGRCCWPHGPISSILPLRGNVDTRLHKLDDGECDALVLAAAGLERLGAARGCPLDADAFTPAPGQGCLALEARTDDAERGELARAITDDEALVCLTAERALVAGIGASCRTPVGAHAHLDTERLTLSAFAGMPDGGAWLRDAVEGSASNPLALGEEAAARLLAAGAAELLREAEAQS